MYMSQVETLIKLKKLLDSVLKAELIINQVNMLFVLDRLSLTLLDAWPSDLSKLLQRDGNALSVIIDSGGGDLFKKVGHILRPGGKLVCYGMYVFVSSLEKAPKTESIFFY